MKYPIAASFFLSRSLHTETPQSHFTKCEETSSSYLSLAYYSCLVLLLTYTHCISSFIIKLRLITCDYNIEIDCIF